MCFTLRRQQILCEVQTPAPCTAMHYSQDWGRACGCLQFERPLGSQQGANRAALKRKNRGKIVIFLCLGFPGKIAFFNFLSGFWSILGLFSSPLTPHHFFYTKFHQFSSILDSLHPNFAFFKKSRPLRPPYLRSFFEKTNLRNEISTKCLRENDAKVIPQFRSFFFQDQKIQLFTMISTPWSPYGIKIDKQVISGLPQRGPLHVLKK